MGQPLYQWPMPDGFPEKASAWTGALLPRWNFALALAANDISGTSVELTSLLPDRLRTSHGATVDSLIELLGGVPAPVSPLMSARAAIVSHLDRARADGVPADRRLAEAAGLLIASPEYQWR